MSFPILAVPASELKRRKIYGLDTEEIPRRYGADTEEIRRRYVRVWAFVPY
jgi:hypothetical protein